MDKLINLVAPEDVSEERETIEKGLHISEFVPENDVIKVLKNGRKNLISMLIGLGFKGYTFVHPRYGHKVNYFATCNTVIMIDYHNMSAMVIEVLNEEERDWFLESIEEHLGLEELEELKKLVVII